MLRTLFVVPLGEHAPGPRYRVFQYLPRLEALGIESTVLVAAPGRPTDAISAAPAPRRPRRLAHLARTFVWNHWAMVRLVRQVRAYDRVLIYRCPVPAWARRALSAHRDRILFDFDDALDQPELEGGMLQHWRARILRRGMQNAVAASGLTITSNRRNAAVVRALGGRVTVIPTCVDVSRAVLRDRTGLSAPAPVLGWIGSPSTARYLLGIEDALTRVAARHTISVRLIGAGCNPFVRFRPDMRPWALSTELEDVSAFDIGLMPMPDTVWTRGKAALKALQYGAAGVPAVASWTETNAEILGEHDGVLLCRSNDDWIDALGRLLTDPALRLAVSARARRLVEARYSADAMAPRLFHAIANPTGNLPADA